MPTLTAQRAPAFVKASPHSLGKRHCNHEETSRQNRLQPVRGFARSSVPLFTLIDAAPIQILHIFEFQAHEADLFHDVRKFRCVLPPDRARTCSMAFSGLACTWAQLGALPWSCTNFVNMISTVHATAAIPSQCAPYRVSAESVRPGFRPI